MPLSPVQVQVSLIGIYVQLAACLLITTLVLGLRREIRAPRYFVDWSWAWVALSAAIFIIGARYLLIPLVATEAGQRSLGPWIPVLHGGYQVAKLWFLVFLLAGTLDLGLDRPASARWRTGALVVAAVVGVSSVLLSSDLNDLVVVQAMAAAPVYAICAWCLRRIPPARRGLGARILTLALLILTVQWLIYIPVFLRGDQLDAGGWPSALAFLARHNSYVDAAELIVLGIGMALLLVENTYRSGQQAQQAQIAEATAARQRLAEILRSANEGIITLSADRRIDLVNPAAEAILGIAAEGARREPLDRWLRDDQRDGFWAAATTVTRRSEANPTTAIRREVIGRRENGDWFPLELALSSFGEGANRGFVVVLRDLTESISARDAHERMQAQLAQAARLEAVGRLVSGVAHELNNPLTAIMAFGQDLLASPRADDDREALHTIVQQAERCRVIVGDLLIFARSRREERRRTLPSDLIKRVTRVFERDSAHLAVGFETIVAPDLPAIDVDAAGMEQVLVNLLTNAFQATPPGGRVSLAVAVVDDRLRITVDDSGPGIPPEVMARLFEPFFTTKAPGEGTGLGLSVSHAIVHQHGGRLVAENRAEGGARFVVDLPYVDRRQADRAEEPPAPSVPAPPSGAGRVLIVDDEAAIRAAVRRSLERHGWSVDEAADGQEAWLKLDVAGRPGVYDAVVTDLRMPGMSGMDLVDRLRADHPALADRTIVITGDTASPAVAEFLRRLPTPYLQKPFDIRALVQMVDRIRAAVE